MKTIGTLGIIVLGFCGGALLGFTWGQGAKSRLGESITNEFKDGRLTVTVDAGRAALGGLADYLR